MVRAPELNLEGLVWFNTPYPLSLEALRGKLVLLDFWTYCCINCMHILPILHRMEQKYGDRLVVIGVHSPKFAAEKESHNVRQAIARYDIHHPIAHDPDFKLWQQYAVRAWPTLTFVSPDGYVIGSHSGEPDEEKLSQAIEAMLAAYDKEGKIDARPLPFSLPQKQEGVLSFPGKIKSAGDRGWIIADSGHHQIHLVSDDGQILQTYGDGKAGFADGIEQARFNNPQGLIADEDAIYVADTGNHAIRRIDWETKRVTNLSGNGRRGPGLTEKIAAGAAILASPWDLEMAGKKIYFANAGTHQIGMLDLIKDTIEPVAGNRRENIVDGPALEAQLAQPSGLAWDAKKEWLYFADSETSSIRRLSMDSSPRVETLVGKGLFSFGHINGAFDIARLQHCLGLCAMGEEMLIADSYNGAMRVLDLKKREIRDFAADFECADPVCLPFDEPAGIAYDGKDRVFLSDSNNHRILVFHLKERRYHTWLG